MKRFILALVLGAFSLSADAELIDRSGGFIYDDVLNITWTQNANINGLGNWPTQVAWAAGLSITDTRPGAGGVVYDDWRLPSMDVNSDDTIVNCLNVTEEACRDNEYGYLARQYIVLSESPGVFINPQSDFYWSGTQVAGNPIIAMIFGFADAGGQGNSPRTTENYAWAVRSGDVAPVPIPAAAWLFGSALGLLGWARLYQG